MELEFVLEFRGSHAGAVGGLALEVPTLVHADAESRERADGKGDGVGTVFQGATLRAANLAQVDFAEDERFGIWNFSADQSQFAATQLEIEFSAVRGKSLGVRRSV
jgi:hypothetical protein